MQKVKSKYNFLFYFLLLGLPLEAGTGLLVSFFEYWEITLFSLVIAHLIIGFILVIPFLFFGIVHGLNENPLQTPPPNKAPQCISGQSERREKIQTSSQNEIRMKKFSFIWGVILFLFLLVSFTLGGFFTVLGVPRQNEWLLQLHIVTGFAGILLLLGHLRKPLTHWFTYAMGFIVPLVFFFNYFAKPEPLQQNF